MTAQAKKYPSLSITYVLIFCIGAACMAVAGYFLIEGLSEFSGNAGTTRMLIIGGVLFQITESICFISASALTYHSLRWRYILFALGMVLFCFSIGVMTLAQKTALQTGETQASANDEKRKHIRDQITSLQKVIDSYRYNAQRQSRSIYKDSRAKGQDSLNRAANLEERKIQLSENLFILNKARRQTSSDFFKRVEEIVGLPAASTEFYFLVARSLLLELSAIILMSFAANLRAYNRLVMEAKENSNIAIQESLFRKVMARVKRGTAAKSNEDGSSTVDLSQTPVSGKASVSNTVNQTNSTATSNLQTASEVNLNSSADANVGDIEHAEYNLVHDKDAIQASVSGQQLSYLVTLVVDLYEQQMLDDLSGKAIRKGINQHCNEKVSLATARKLSKLVTNRLDEPC